RVDVSNEVAELPGVLVFSRVDDQDRAIALLAFYVLGEGVGEAERLVGISHAVRSRDDVLGVAGRLQLLCERAGGRRRKRLEQVGAEVLRDGFHGLPQMCLRASTTGSCAARLAGISAANVDMRTSPTQIPRLSSPTSDVRTLSGTAAAWAGGGQVSPA